MKFRLAAIDLDGTLLNGAKQLTRRSIESLRRASRNGLTVIICTGRMIRSAEPYWREVGLDTPIVGYNGAHVKDTANGRDILLRPIPPVVTQDIIRFCRRQGVVPFTYHNDNLFVERDCDEVKGYSHTYGVDYKVIEDLIAFLTKGSTKILISCKPSECGGLAAKMHEKFGDRTSVTQSEGRHVELNHPLATKASAVRFLAKQFGVQREEILAFGDGINDVSMLEYAGFGVAVANAWEEAKQAADEVIGSNDEDAVASFLDSLHA